MKSRVCINCNIYCFFTGLEKLCQELDKNIGQVIPNRIQTAKDQYYGCNSIYNALLKKSS